MQKIKKALKSLVKLGQKSAPQKPAKKPVSAKAPAAKAAKKKVTSATVKNTVKNPVKKKTDVKKKSAPVAKKAAPAKAAPAKKAVAPVTKKTSTVKAAAPVKATAKVAAAPAKADSKAKKGQAPVTTAKLAAAPAAKSNKDGGKEKLKATTAKVDKKKAKGTREEDEIPELDDVDDVVIEETDGPVPAEYAGSEPESDEVVLTDAEGRRYCRVKDCDQASAVDGYCRYHYLLLWKKIQVRKKILSEGKLERYIEDLTARYPDKYLEMLRKDLRSEKDFMAAIHELEIDESASEGEFEDETQSFAEEIRGMSGSDTPARDDDEF